MGSNPIIGIFIYVAQAVERVLAVAFRIHNIHKRKHIAAPAGIRIYNLSRRWAVHLLATGTGEVSHLRIENEN